MVGTLYLVGTPIGNLDDMSVRAINTLNSVDFIAAEDTRNTSHLLNHFGIKKPLTSYYEHNKATKGRIICDKILKGESCALVTDAGMPAISDPGQDIVDLCHKLNISVVVIPGPSALISALALSGLDSARFTFEGFLSTDKKKRKEHLSSLVDEERTMIFYEAPHKLLSTLNDMKEYFGSRVLSISREITKIYEETILTTIDDAITMYESAKPRGEFVLVVCGIPAHSHDVFTLEQAIIIAQNFISEGKSINEAAKLSAKETKLKKSDIYKLLIENKKALED